VAGSVPGRTQTVPLAVYASVESRYGSQAMIFALTLTAIACVMLDCVGGFWLRFSNSSGKDY
jgi:ABC-type molybdate transport system permease subunit